MGNQNFYEGVLIKLGHETAAIAIYVMQGELASE